MKKQYDLNRDSFQLMNNEPFFAGLFRRLDRKATTAIPTAGVHLNPDTLRFELLYNPEFFGGLPREQRLDILKHEGYHIVFGHCTTRRPAEEQHMQWNIACDLAINSFLDNLPEGCCKAGHGRFEDQPPFKAAEWYFQELEKKKKENQKSQDSEDQEGESSPDGSSGGSGGSDGSGESSENKDNNQTVEEQFDSHDGWNETNLSEAEKEIAKERLRDAVREAATEAGESRNWGSVPSTIREDIRKEYLQTYVNWRTVLRWFIQTSQPAHKTNSIKRLNRRYPWVHPGTKTTRTAKIAISIDQSGSVSTTMLQAFYAELGKLAKLASFTVIPFDSEVFEDGIHEWKKGESKAWKRYCHGGTDFDAPTKLVNEDKKFDAHIVLTDLCAPKPKKSRCPRMWITTEYYARRPYFQTSERIISIPDRDC